ncbi:MAG: hypothetical protein M3O62_04125 [Pseudomonadota bacterium]|nr:hypothetical protein [Pseudomonadota bacterium]
MEEVKLQDDIGETEMKKIELPTARRLMSTALSATCLLAMSGCYQVSKSLGIPVAHNPELPMEESSYFVDQIFKSEYAMKPAPGLGKDPFKAVGVWPMLSIQKVDGIPSSADQYPSGRHAIQFKCYMPYETGFRSLDVSLGAEPGMRYEFFSANKECTEVRALVFRRQADDRESTGVSLDRVPLTELRSSPGYPELIDEATFRMRASRDRVDRFEDHRADIRAEAQQRAKNKVETLRAGVGTRICSFPNNATAEGFIDRVENNKIRIQVTRLLLQQQTEKYIWDDPENWIICR